MTGRHDPVFQSKMFQLIGLKQWIFGHRTISLWLGLSVSKGAQFILIYVSSFQHAAELTYVSSFLL